MFWGRAIFFFLVLLGSVGFVACHKKEAESEPPRAEPPPISYPAPLRQSPVQKYILINDQVDKSIEHRGVWL